MANPNALFLLADHIKLSLLERQRAQALNLGGDSQDGHISRSLDQFRDGLEGLDKERERLEAAGDERCVMSHLIPTNPLHLVRRASTNNPIAKPSTLPTPSLPSKSSTTP